MRIINITLILLVISAHNFVSAEEDGPSVTVPILSNPSSLCASLLRWIPLYGTRVDPDQDSSSKNKAIGLFKQFRFQILGMPRATPMINPGTFRASNNSGSKSRVAAAIDGLLSDTDSESVKTSYLVLRGEKEINSFQSDVHSTSKAIQVNMLKKSNFEFLFLSFFLFPLAVSEPIAHIKLFLSLGSIYNPVASFYLYIINRLPVFLMRNSLRSSHVVADLSQDWEFKTASFSISPRVVEPEAIVDDESLVADHIKSDLDELTQKKSKF